MGELLNLSITLQSPADQSAADAIACIRLNCDALGLIHEGDVLLDPLTDSERSNLLWYLEEYWKWPYDMFAARAERIVRELMPNVGRRLYQSIFGSAGAANVVQAWRLQSGVQHQISILSGIPKALSLPWELLHDEQGFLALRTRPVSILRRLPQNEAASLLAPFTPPLRILLITARPDRSGFVDPRIIARELLDELQPQIERGTIELEFLRPPTLTALRERLRGSERPIHIVHFDGHGVFPQQYYPDRLLAQDKSQAGLEFESADGGLHLVAAAELAQVLQSSDVRLAVITACQSAVGAYNDPFSSVASRLIQAGTDAVVAMSARVLVESAARYAEAFYRALASGIPVPVAQEYARQALHDDPRRHPFRRRQDEEAEPVMLSDWWLPHFYQQRPLTLRPSTGISALQRRTRKLSNMPAAPRHGFSGRARELLLIERFLIRKRLVVIHGFGGVGKTALTRETADWVTRTGMFSGTCFVSFEGGGDSTQLLSVLGSHLECYDSDFNPSDSHTALEKLRFALREQSTLIVADNIESILTSGETPLDRTSLIKLWDVLTALSDMEGCGILLTTRDTSFDDVRLIEGQRVAYLPLKGLHPEDAYALASRLMYDSGINRAGAEYSALRELLTYLDHHPLSIQLVLPALHELSLDVIRRDFTKLLSRFTDNTVNGRNSSLSASLEYSLVRIGPKQRAFLSRLSPFEIGANEQNILWVTEIPEQDWLSLRSTLEQSALVTVEQIHPNFNVPFLRFHPTLIPFIRSQSNDDVSKFRDRFIRRYHTAIVDLYYQDTQHPAPVRAVVRSELPNFRRALKLAIEAGDLKVISEMSECLTSFLNDFGMRRERDEIRQKVSAVLGIITTREGELSVEEYLQEIGSAHDEFQKRDLRAAKKRLTELTRRIESLSVGNPCGLESYPHAASLQLLARCLRDDHQPEEAEVLLRKALNICDELILREPGNRELIAHRGVVLMDLSTVLREQGKFEDAWVTCKEGEQVAEQQSDKRGQAVALFQLGGLALKLLNPIEAYQKYMEALSIFHSIEDFTGEADTWNQLGLVAQSQKKWSEAERCFRESLMIRERLGDEVDVAKMCNNLGAVAEQGGNPEEAKGWYRRALEIDRRLQPGSPNQASHLNNFANILANEAKAKGGAKEILHEAKANAEEALSIRKKLGASSEIWTTFFILAFIADQEGRTEDAQSYRRLGREAFAAFEGNRYYISKLFGDLIVGIAEAAFGDDNARVAVINRIQSIIRELQNTRFKWEGMLIVVQRIWAGERDWQKLVKELDEAQSLIILLALEKISS